MRIDGLRAVPGEEAVLVVPDHPDRGRIKCHQDVVAGLLECDVDVVRQPRLFPGTVGYPNVSIPISPYFGTVVNRAPRKA